MSQDILPVVEEYDPDADDDDDADDVTTEATTDDGGAVSNPLTWEEILTDPHLNGTAPGYEYPTDDDDATDAATPEENARAATRLFNALQMRGGVNLVIARPDDEPLVVNVDKLLTFEYFADRVAYIAQENNEDEETVVRLLCRAPLTFDDDPEPPTTTRPEHDDDAPTDDAADNDGVVTYDPTEDADAPTFDVTDDGAAVFAPRWARDIREIFKDADRDIKEAHDKDGDNSDAAYYSRGFALREIFDIVRGNRLTLRAVYTSCNISVNNILDMFFDGLGALEEIENKEGLISRRVKLTHNRHTSAHTFVSVMSKGAVNWLYYAFRNGLTEDGRKYAHVEITE